MPRSSYSKNAPIDEGKTIIGGPASFVVTADRDDRFAQAVRRKLLLEIAGGPAPRSG